MKDQILEELHRIDRAGMDELIEFLERSDYFTAPASCNHHLAREGGLAEHSWNVFQAYITVNDFYGAEVDYQTMVIESLLHDLCKVNTYKFDDEAATAKQIKYLTDLANQKNEYIFVMGEKVQVYGTTCFLSKSLAGNLISWLKGETSLPELTPGYIYDDSNAPFGHGEKSVILAQQYIRLKPNEIAAIRWHMGLWEGFGHEGHQIKMMRTASEQWPDVKLLHIADQMASFKEEWE